MATVRHVIKESTDEPGYVELAIGEGHSFIFEFVRVLENGTPLNFVSPVKFVVWNNENPNLKTFLEGQGITLNQNRMFWSNSTDENTFRHGTYFIDVRSDGLNTSEHLYTGKLIVRPAKAKK